MNKLYFVVRDIRNELILNTVCRKCLLKINKSQRVNSHLATFPYGGLIFYEQTHTARTLIILTGIEQVSARVL